jgi:acyl carrier protein
METIDTVAGTIRRFILCTNLPGESPDALSDNTPLQSSGILDSLATVGLIAFLEKEFHVELDVYDTAIERFDTIHDIASTVAAKQTRPLSGRTTS